MTNPEEKARIDEKRRNQHQYKPKEIGTVYVKLTGVPNKLNTDTTHKRNGKPIYPEYPIAIE